MWLAIVYNKMWKKYSIHTTRNFSYNKNGAQNKGLTHVCLPLSASDSPNVQLSLIYQYAKQLKEEGAMKMF